MKLAKQKGGQYTLTNRSAAWPVLRWPPKLKARRGDGNESDLVVVPPRWKMLDYWHFRRVLKELCKVAGVPEIATHGLRHSTSGIYRQHGASREDLRQLYGHTDASTTERYTHGEGENLQKVAKVIRLFDKCSPDVPREGRKEGVNT